MGKVYVVEHMEPDEQTPSKPLPDWVFLEYFHMLQQVGIVAGKEDAKLFTEGQEFALSQPTVNPSSLDQKTPSRVFFSHLSEITCESLINEINSSFQRIHGVSNSIARPLSALSTNSITQSHLANCVCSRLSILDFLVALKVEPHDVCLLDPKAEQELKPEDGGRFQWFLFGGILGDDPPRDRTAQLRMCGFPSRHLGSIQMTTDTALAVTKRIVENGRTLQDLEWIDKPELVFNSKEKVEMPFRYLSDTKGQPIMPHGMKELIHKDLDRAFEF